MLDTLGRSRSLQAALLGRDGTLKTRPPSQDVVLWQRECGRNGGPLRANVTQVNWPEAQFQGWRVGLNPEIILARGDEERVGYERMLIVAPLLPLLPGTRSQGQLSWLGVGAGVEVEVPSHLIVLVARPVASQQGAGVEIDKVGDEAEAEVRLRTGALNLVVAREGEDVVAEDVRLTVVLVKPAMRRAVNDIVLGQDAAAAFVEVDAPAAVANGRDVMP